MSATSDKSAAEKLEVVEQEVARFRDEYESLKSAIGDPKVGAWIDGHGRSPARKLTTFEAAAVKRMFEIKARLPKLRAAEAFLVARTLDETSGKPGAEDPVEDPEALLRAALVVLARAWKAGHRDIEHRVTLKAIAAYLRSLDEE
jgi:hypothetical protein